VTINTIVGLMFKHSYTLMGLVTSQKWSRNLVYLKFPRSFDMKYRSTFEGMVHMALGDDWEFEPLQMEYTVPRKYTPDFVKGKIYVETKGYFREGDTQKYRAINDQCTVDGNTLVFVLMNPDKKVRRGANLSMAGWCEKNNIPWFSMETINELRSYDE
jgi:hypothetical protein